MEVLFILLPATLLIGGLFVGLFIFSVNKGQFEELEGPANRALIDDTLVKQQSNNINDHHENKGREDGSK